MKGGEGCGRGKTEDGIEMMEHAQGTGRVFLRMNTQEYQYWWTVMVGIESLATESSKV